ncbi:MAG: site-specific DNA-methyltransferase, partial [Oscillospiraceae bacterium]
AQTTKSNPETLGRYHTNWLNMMYPRLRLAANLLRDDGVIFISIDDNEVFNLKKVCDEVFGEENYVACFPRVTKKAGKTTDDVAKNHDFFLMYTKSNTTVFNLQSHTDDGFKNSDEFVEQRGKYKLNQTLDYDSLQYSPSLDYPIEIDGKVLYPGNSLEKYQERKQGNYARADWAWRWSKDLFDFGYANGFIVVKHYDDYSRIYTKTYQNARIVKKGNIFVVETFERTKALSSLEFIENEYSNDNSKKNLSVLFDTSVFDYSKPISLIKFLCQFSTSGNDIILDFFSGSATTAHAVMQLNAEDGGNRKFIMVQLPEVTDEKSEAYKAGYKNICEIGKERIRRAGAKLTETDGQEILEKKKDLDVGFKVFKLDTSNLREWDSTPVADNDLNLFYQRLNDMVDSIKPDRTAMDVVYEVSLKMGIPLDVPVTYMEVTSKICYVVGDLLLLICFAENLTADDITAMAEYAPAKMILAEQSFADDTALSNAHYILRDKQIELKLV